MGTLLHLATYGFRSFYCRVVPAVLQRCHMRWRSYLAKQVTAATYVLQKPPAITPEYDSRAGGAVNHIFVRLIPTTSVYQHIPMCKAGNYAIGKIWENMRGKSRYTAVQGSTEKYSNLLILCGAQEETRTLTPHGAGT